jgi:hypothetical protein
MTLQSDPGRTGRYERLYYLINNRQHARHRGQIPDVPVDDAKQRDDGGLVDALSICDFREARAKAADYERSEFGGNQPILDNYSCPSTAQHGTVFAIN